MGSRAFHVLSNIAAFKSTGTLATYQPRTIFNRPRQVIRTPRACPEGRG